MGSVLLDVIGELGLAIQAQAQKTRTELMIDALNVYMISAGIVICTSMIPSTHAQGAPSRWIGSWLRAAE
jgi:hypothetical protein